MTTKTESAVRILRFVLGALSIVTLCAVSTMHAQEAGRVEGLTKKAPEERFRLAGIVRMAGKSYASIADNNSRMSEWLSVGAYHLGYYIKEISENSVVLTERGSGKETTLYVTGLGNSTGTSRPQIYSVEWINSDENPMYYVPSGVPLDITREWTNLTNEDKTQIIELYRKFGWNLISANSVAGSTEFAWENIYEKERKAATAKAKSDFESSLNPDQQAIYAKIRATPAPVVSRGAPRSAEQLEGDRVRQIEWSKLKATLSPTQREIYEAILDSKKAMKRKG